MTVQTNVTAGQNAVDRSQLRVTTGNTQLWRSIGGTLGVVLSGAILNRELRHWLLGHVGRGAVIDPAEVTRWPGDTAHLPPQLVSDLHSGFAASLHTVFVDLIPFALLILGATLLLKELPLRRVAGIGDIVTDEEAERIEPGPSTLQA